MNKIILKGNITKDIELRQTNNNKRIVNFCIAVKRNFKNKEGKYETDFFYCTAFDNLCDLLNNFFKKGQEILIIGHLQNNQWETESGEKRTATNIIVENVEFCGKKEENNNNNNFESTMQQNGMQVTTTNASDDLPF